MATLASLKPSDTFDSLLHLEGETSGFTSALKDVEDGVGGTGALKLALTGQTIGASFDGNVGIGNVAPGNLLEVSASASVSVIEASCYSTDIGHEPVLKLKKSNPATVNTEGATEDD